MRILQHIIAVSVLESLFELLFKYRPVVFEQGDFRFGTTSAMYVAAVAATAVVASTVLTYRRIGGKSRPRDRALLAALRLAVLAIVLFCLFRPVLVIKAAVPQQNFLGILVDDSRSMRIADRDGQPRAAFAQGTFVRPDSPLRKTLGDRFAVRLFRFSAAAERLTDAEDLTFSGTQTRLARALGNARDELAGLPLAGLVVVTDGADTSEASLGESLLALKADGLPVFTVGVGRDSLTRDIQVSRVATPRAVLKGTSLVVDVTLTHAGYSGSSVSLNVESDGRIVSSQEVKLAGTGEPTTVRARFTAAEAGPKVFRFRVPPQPGEEVTQNNAREVLIEVEDRREKILYFEGEPRSEVKFIRRAVADDPNLQVVVLQRTAENKYLRIYVDHAEELIAGFPKTREELFAYRAIILGSIEAGAFTGDQLRMIADFVDRRGGGLLMIGGRRAFAEGDYAGTPVADVLPVVLEPPQKDAPVARLRVRPTRVGLGHAVTQIAKTEQESAARWADLPHVIGVNPIRQVKPGATVLLTGLDEGSRREQVVLAYQRYGRGRALALPLLDTWIWQMHSTITVEDMTHESFWRQLLRWLVDGVPANVELRMGLDRVDPGEAVTLVANVADATYVEMNNGRVLTTVTRPSGGTLEVPLQWTGEKNGEYRGTFTAEEEGLYGLRVEATRDGATIGVDETQLRAAAGEEEYFDAAMRASLLKRIADETGGRFYTEANADKLAEDLRYTGRGVTVVEERELWDMPVLLLLLLGLMLGEWSCRRARDLA